MKLLRTLLLAAGLAVVAAPTALNAAPTVLTLAVGQSPHSAALLIAESEGYFAAEGLKLNILRCVIGRVCLKMLLDGQAHVATVADTPIVFASFLRKDFAVIATIAVSGGELRMVVRQDRGIHKAADLKGKRIGTLTGTSAHYFTDTFLRFHGIDASEVSIVALEASDASAALLRGAVDAAGLFDPHGGAALRALGANGGTLPAPRFISNSFNLVSVGASSGASDADLAKLLRSLQRANELIHVEPQRARAIVAAALKIEPRELEESWKDYDFKLQLTPALLSGLEAQARWALGSNLVPSESRQPDYLDFVRAAPLRLVVPRAVRLIQ
jgi:ABC-type nitrate/sulfonate/bicarbonate transport system substrate-binding protein